jgi:type IV pilus assembly protein PilX
MPTCQQHCYSSKNQAGLVLLISLIFLTLLSLIGLSGVQATGLEEKIANNMGAKSMAFQAAEDALKTGEQQVIELNSAQTTSLGNFFNCLPESPTDGLFKQQEPDVENQNIENQKSNFWSQPDVFCGVDVSEICKNDKRQPKYVIQCLSTPGLYRITSYARGETADSEVILQSVFNVNQDNTTLTP